MIDSCAFVYLGSLSQSDNKIWFKVGTLDHVISAQSPKELETEIRFMGCQLCLYDGDPIKTLDTKGQVSFHGCQYSMYIVTHYFQEDLMLS